MSIGTYYRSYTGTIHLAPCAYVDETTPEWFAGQGVTVREIASYVAAARALRLCPECWPADMQREVSA